MNATNPSFWTLSINTSYTIMFVCVWCINNFHLTEWDEKARIKWINKIQFSRPCDFEMPLRKIKRKSWLPSNSSEFLLRERKSGRKNEGIHSRTPIYIYITRKSHRKSPTNHFEHCEFQQKSVYRNTRTDERMRRNWHFGQHSIPSTFIADVMTAILNGNGDGVSNESGSVTC